MRTSPRRPQPQGLRRAAAATFVAAALLSATGHGFAASTGTSSLLMPQGSAAGTANGDYVTAATGGLNTFYRYFIEVPPSLSRLRIQLFDADIGAGGTGEAYPAQRDRTRGTFNTTATYSLVDPGGTARLTQFTTGDTANPAGGDNAWLTFFDGNGKDVRDNFTTAAFTNNDGTNNWAAAWIETDAGGAGATTGSVLITGGQLRIHDNVGGTPSLERQVDLSATGLNFQTAYLSLDLGNSGNLANGDNINIQISNNGGTSYTTLEAVTSASATGHRDYNITSFISNNTRVRFIVAGGLNNNARYYSFDNVDIHSGGAITAGHWELRVSQSAGGDDINALGIRADDGDDSSGGTEIPVYYDSQSQYGVNTPPSGTTDRNYTVYPYITSGCSMSENDFDYDSDSGNTGAITLSSRTATFSQSISSASLAVNDMWARNNVSGWTSDTDSEEDGIWSAAVRITSYVNGAGQNGNYANIYFANSSAAANPPTANPTTNAFRVYFPTDGGTAPVKPYLEQQLRFTGSGGADGPNPPVVGQDSIFTVTVRAVNPTASAITFSATNLVTANVPGPAANVKYDGIAQVSQGTVTAAPAVGGTGNVTWNPGTLAAGSTALLAYRIVVHPTSAGQRIVVTGTVASGNGTRATWVDETGNTTQTRATYTFGPLCELAATQGLLTPAVLSSLRAVDAGGAVQVEWKTASEAGTLGYYLYRKDVASGRWTKVHDGLLLALVGAPQGGSYRFRDAGASAREPQTYRLVEVSVDGKKRSFAPVTLFAEPAESGVPTLGPEAPFERTAHSGIRRNPPAAESERAATAPVGGGAPFVGARLGIRQTGLYYLSTADLAAALELPAARIAQLLAKGSIAITSNSQPVAWAPSGADKNSYDGLLFYGQAIDSLYSAENAYHLSSGRGVEMTSEPAGAAGGGAASFADTAHAEVDAFPATALPLDPESDYWFWDFVQAGDPTFGSKTFRVDAPGLASGGAATLTVNLHGASSSGVTGEHHLSIAVNGTPVGETRATGIVPWSASFPVDPALLQAAGNQVAVSALLDDGTPYSIVYVDSFDLTYPRAFQAQGDALAFRGSGALSIGGFSGPAVRVLDVASPLAPRLVAGAATGSDGAGGTAVRFVPAASGAPYLAVGPGGLLHPSSVRPWLDLDLHSTGNRADYLVLAPAALRSPAERLAAYRSAQGLAARVVDVEAVMDEWNGGVSNPHAIAAFLAYARTHWATPPRYAVLAGTGSVDYRNLLGYGDSLMPPLMVANTGGLFPSDAHFADGAGPALAVGRIPAATAADLDAYVDKLIAYEADGGGGWAGRTVLLSDATDQSADFAAGNEQVAGLLRVGTSPDRIDLGATTLADARSALFADLSQGTALLNYLGHGGLDRLASGGLLDNQDVAGLQNGPRLPVLTAMTCVVNRFSVPGIRSLGELLTVQPGGGAAAVWAATGLSLAGEAPLLAERFYRLTADPTADGARLGDLVVRSLAEFAKLGGSPAMTEIYSLLGDPALRVKRAPAPARTASPGTGE